MIIYILILFIIFYVFYLKYNHQRLYGRYNLKGPFCWPIIGTLPSFVFVPSYQFETNNLKKYGKTYIEFFPSWRSNIVTSDPKLAKQILVKDFYNFQYRNVTNYLPKYARKSLIFRSDDWKRIRTQLSPIFTSSRLKVMFNNFEYPINNCLKNIDQLIDAKENANVEIKNLMRGFALDMIGNVVFSLKTNAYKNDEFSTRLRSIFMKNVPVAILSLLLPFHISKLFDLSFFDSKTVQVFANMTFSLIEERKKNRDVVYNDFIELLLKSEIEGEVIDKSVDGHIIQKLSKEEIVASCMDFFLGGMETVSNTLLHLLLELALNPDIQEKLHQDLMHCYPNQKVSYDEINKSQYLDWVIKENIRMHAALNRIIRVAINDHDLGQFKVKKGQFVSVSLFSLHHDPELFPDPYTFKPERFANEVDESILFMPFGIGPRNCIAERFALLELKSLAIRLVKCFKFYKNENTMKYRYRNADITNFVGDLRLRIERR